MKLHWFDTFGKHLLGPDMPDKVVWRIALQPAGGHFILGETQMTHPRHHKGIPGWRASPNWGVGGHAPVTSGSVPFNKLDAVPDFSHRKRESVYISICVHI